MEPSLYVPVFLARTYAREHPDLTPAAIELVRDEIALHPETYATEVHAQACLSYARVHANLHSGLSRMEELSDEEYESQRSRLFEQTPEPFQNRQNGSRLHRCALGRHPARQRALG